MNTFLASVLAFASTLSATEFTFSIVEHTQIESWKNAPYDVESFSKDPAGLYVLGMYHLLGQNGNSIDVERAHTYFAASASFGFAPALNKIKQRCEHQDKNVFLSLIYLNLTASSGHPEYVMEYHKERSFIVTQYGEHCAKEMERIASEKAKIIAQNKEKPELSQNITAADAGYTHSYFVNK